MHGELSAEQQIAVDAMLEHDDGVLLAPPGAGKTVMGCAVIAKRKVSTLILVHRKPLKEQWRSRLQQFLGCDKKEIGILGGEPKDIVIGMVQTLAKSACPEALFAPFSQVIIDEYHHVPAASFEAVMKSCLARYFLGLTATPNRKNGLQKILFLTLPISFKGRLIQYAGRLHRKNEGKSEVRIYDYVEPEHPLTAHMHRKRLSAFRGMGYEVASVSSQTQN